MFVALHAKDGSRFTSIDPSWDDSADKLRSLTHNGELVCPGCRQTLWLRTGDAKRRHFAHRSLTDCPLEKQSVEVLEAKAQLYRWLTRKFPGKVVMDTAIGMMGLDKLIDLVVAPDSDRKFAYWVFDRQQRDRRNFSVYRSLPTVHVHFIHTLSTLHGKPEVDELALTASQRDFITCSEFDTSVAWKGTGHLTFYQVESSAVLIYRGLHCVHRPNLYRWAALRQGGLDSVLISSKTGELVFSEDEKTRQAWRQKRKNETALASIAGGSSGLLARRDSGASSPESIAADDDDISDEDVSTLRGPNLNGPFRCEDCGMETSEWSSATPSAGTCVCKVCTTKRWERTKASS